MDADFFENGGKKSVFKQRWIPGTGPQIKRPKFPKIPIQFHPLSKFVMSFVRSLSSDVFEPRTSTGSGLFQLLSSDFKQIFE